MTVGDDCVSPVWDLLFILYEWINERWRRWKRYR